MESMRAVGTAGQASACRLSRRRLRACAGCSGPARSRRTWPGQRLRRSATLRLDLRRRRRAGRAVGGHRRAARRVARSTSSAWRGKVVVVNFWGSWCAPCRAEAHALQQVYADDQGRRGRVPRRRHQGRRRRRAALRSAQARRRPTRACSTRRHALALRFRGRAAERDPDHAVIDRQGRIAARHSGSIQLHAAASTSSTAARGAGVSDVSPTAGTLASIAAGGSLLLAVPVALRRRAGLVPVAVRAAAGAGLPLVRHRPDRRGPRADTSGAAPEPTAVAPRRRMRRHPGRVLLGRCCSCSGFTAVFVSEGALFGTASARDLAGAPGRRQPGRRRAHDRARPGRSSACCPGCSASGGSTGCPRRGLAGAPLLGVALRPSAGRRASARRSAPC